MLSNEHYPFSVTRAAIVLTHMQVAQRVDRQSQSQNTRSEQISRNIYCKSQWRHMYSMSCDILCIESWNVPWTHLYMGGEPEVDRINIFRVTQSRSVCGAGYGSCSNRFRCSSPRDSHSIFEVRIVIVPGMQCISQCLLCAYCIVCVRNSHFSWE